MPSDTNQKSNQKELWITHTISRVSEIYNYHELPTSGHFSEQQRRGPELAQRFKLKDHTAVYNTPQDIANQTRRTTLQSLTVGLCTGGATFGLIFGLGLQPLGAAIFIFVATTILISLFFPTLRDFFTSLLHKKKYTAHASPPKLIHMPENVLHTKDDFFEAWVVLLTRSLESTLSAPNFFTKPGQFKKILQKQTLHLLNEAIFPEEWTKHITTAEAYGEKLHAILASPQVTPYFTIQKDDEGTESTSTVQMKPKQAEAAFTTALYLWALRTTENEAFAKSLIEENYIPSTPKRWYMMNRKATWIQAAILLCCIISVSLIVLCPQASLIFFALTAKWTAIALHAMVYILQLAIYIGIIQTGSMSDTLVHDTQQKAPSDEITRRLYTANKIVASQSQKDQLHALRMKARHAQRALLATPGGADHLKKMYDKDPNLECQLTGYRQGTFGKLYDASGKGNNHSDRLKPSALSAWAAFKDAAINVAQYYKQHQSPYADKKTLPRLTPKQLTSALSAINNSPKTHLYHLPATQQTTPTLRQSTTRQSTTGITQALTTERPESTATPPPEPPPSQHTPHRPLKETNAQRNVSPPDQRSASAGAESTRLSTDSQDENSLCKSESNSQSSLYKFRFTPPADDGGVSFPSHIDASRRGTRTDSGYPLSISPNLYSPPLPLPPPAEITEQNSKATAKPIASGTKNNTPLQNKSLGARNSVFRNINPHQNPAARSHKTINTKEGKIRSKSSSDSINPDPRPAHSSLLLRPASVSPSFSCSRYQRALSPTLL